MAQKSFVHGGADSLFRQMCRPRAWNDPNSMMRLLWEDRLNTLKALPPGPVSRSIRRALDIESEESLVEHADLWTNNG